MTGNEIISNAEAYFPSSYSIGTATALIAINEAMAWIGNNAFVVGEITVIGAEANRLYTLPESVTRVIRAEDRTTDPDNPKYVYNYRFVGNNISFDEDGTYVIIARRTPEELDALTAETGLHRSYENCIVTYLRAFVKLINNDKSPDGLRLMDKFERDVAIVSDRMRKRFKRPSQVRVVRHA